MTRTRFTLETRHARAIVANPTPRQSPMLRRLAWCVLKSGQGQPARQSRLTDRRGPTTPGAA